MSTRCIYPWLHTERLFETSTTPDNMNMEEILSFYIKYSLHSGTCMKLICVFNFANVSSCSFASFYSLCMLVSFTWDTLYYKPSRR